MDIRCSISVAFKPDVLSPKTKASAQDLQKGVKLSVLSCVSCFLNF